MAFNGLKLAVGTTGGELKIFAMDQFPPAQITSFIAHSPSEEPHNTNFGSLTLFSEIWTLCWNPDGRNELATGSEDQTVVIWNLDDLSKIATLPKHRNAVTGVNWKKVKEVTFGDATLTELFVSCSDDQHLRVYNPSNWSLLHTFQTTFICEWHTLTYLALEDHGTRVCVVSQNGYLFIYDLQTRECLFGEKIHSGSVEGLCWMKRFAATVSSDCSVTVLNMQKTVGGVQATPFR